MIKDRAANKSEKPKPSEKKKWWNILENWKISKTARLLRKEEKDWGGRDLIWEDGKKIARQRMEEERKCYGENEKDEGNEEGSRIMGHNAKYYQRRQIELES